MVSVPYGANQGASGLALVDVVKRAASSPPAAGGQAIASIGPVPTGQVWIIDRINVSMTAGTPTIALYDDASLGAVYFLDGASAGVLNVSEYPTGIVIEDTRSLYAVWGAASDGAVGTVRAQFRIMQRPGVT